MVSVSRPASGRIAFLHAVMKVSVRMSLMSAVRSSTVMPPILSLGAALEPTVRPTAFPTLDSAMRTRSLLGPSKLLAVETSARSNSASMASVSARGVPDTIWMLARILSASGVGKKLKATRPPATMPTARSSSPNAMAKVAYRQVIQIPTKRRNGPSRKASN